jgi:hypothetical protein
MKTGSFPWNPSERDWETSGSRPKWSFGRAKNSNAWKRQNAKKLRERDEGSESVAAIAPSSGSTPAEADSSKDMSRTLEQLRSLGELKDAGYVTEDEFERIKQKILNSQL